MPELRTVTVQFGNEEMAAARRGHVISKPYHYLVPFGDMPKVGDFVLTTCSTILNTQTNERFPTGVTAGRVMEVHDYRSPKAERFYTMTVPLAAVERARNNNAALKAAQIEAQKLRDELESRLEAQTARQRYAALAAEDPEAAEMLKMLEDLDAGNFALYVPGVGTDA